MHNPHTRRGFTILELMVVISIMAIIATMAIGAAGKAVKQARNKRIDAMAAALEVALNNYRAQENEWPFALADLDRDRNDANKYWAHGKRNVNVFRKLYHGAGGSKTVYLDASGLLTETGGNRMSLRAALDQGRSDCPLGYPLPNNTSTFHFYCVLYLPLTDTVKVMRQGDGHTCTAN